MPEFGGCGLVHPHILVFTSSRFSSRGCCHRGRSWQRLARLRSQGYANQRKSTVRQARNRWTFTLCCFLSVAQSAYRVAITHLLRRQLALPVRSRAWSSLMHFFTGLRGKVVAMVCPDFSFEADGCSAA